MFMLVRLISGAIDSLRFDEIFEATKFVSTYLIGLWVFPRHLNLAPSRFGQIHQGS